MAVNQPVRPDVARVLVVEDDRDLADLIALWVGELWDCEIVHTAEAALETIDDATDVVLLDRHLPDRSGDEVLTTIRDRGLDVAVMMVSGVTPDVDLVGLPVDDYYEKPVERGRLQAKIQQLLLRRQCKPAVEEYYGCAAILEAIEAASPDAAYASTDAYRALKRRATELRQRVDASLPVATGPLSRAHAVDRD